MVNARLIAGRRDVFFFAANPRHVSYSTASGDFREFKIELEMFNSKTFVIHL